MPLLDDMSNIDEEGGTGYFLFNYIIRVASDIIFTSNYI